MFLESKCEFYYENEDPETFLLRLYKTQWKP